VSASDALENGLGLLLFNNTDLALIGDAAGLQNSAVAGSFFISLHTADPGDAGTQLTSEATYTGYARVAVARSSAGWTVSAANISNAAAVTFAQCTAGSNTITYFGIGETASGAGTLWLSGILDASLAVSAGITPAFAIGVLDVNIT
jgi:hypothetical protein